MNQLNCGGCYYQQLIENSIRWYELLSFTKRILGPMARSLGPLGETTRQYSPFLVETIHMLCLLFRTSLPLSSKPELKVSYFSSQSCFCRLMSRQHLRPSKIEGSSWRHQQSVAVTRRKCAISICFVGPLFYCLFCRHKVRSLCVYC